MKKIRISSDALSDLNEGFLFYEHQDSGLGDYFTSCLRSDIEELRLTGGVHRIVHRQVYRSLSRVFPYGIFYPRMSVWFSTAKHIRYQNENKQIVSLEVIIDY